MSDILLRNLPFLAHGLLTTLMLAGWTMLFGTLLAIPIALARHLRIPFAAQICTVYVEFIRGTPLLVVLLLFYFAFPALFGYRTSATTACIIGFSAVLAAYCAEDMRAGLAAVPVPLIEAARALGLTPLANYRHIIVPLAARIAVPPLIGQYVRMLKYTSVASVIGVTELTGASLLVNARVFQPLTLLGATAATYLILCLSLSLAGRWLRRRLDFDEV